MSAQFIYVFSTADRDSLLTQGLKCLINDERKNTFIFAMPDQMSFSLDVSKYCLSDTISL